MVTLILIGRLRGVRTQRSLVCENLPLRQQLAVLQRSSPRPRLRTADRLFWVLLCRMWSGWADALAVVKPETVIRWHRAGFTRYREHCMACHGSSGQGDGPAAAGLHPKPADLTAPHTGDHTAGDLFWWLSHGIHGSAMPGFADRLSESDRWDLINFIRALASSEQARMLGPVIAPRPSIIAPDLTFAVPNRETRSLKDYRGRAVVLLVFFTWPESRDRLSQLSRVYPAPCGTSARRSWRFHSAPAGCVQRPAAPWGSPSRGTPATTSWRRTGSSGAI